MKKLINKTDRVISFVIGQDPGQPPLKYEVAPGEVCEVAEGYCKVVEGRSIIKMIAPGLEEYKGEDKKKAAKADLFDLDAEDSKKAKGRTSKRGE